MINFLMYVKMVFDKANAIKGDIQAMVTQLAEEKKRNCENHRLF